jgi:hypothetical protein
MPTLDMGMRGVGAQAGRAGIPAEMVKLVTGIRHVDLADDRAIFVGGGIDVDDGDVIGGLAVRVEGRDIGDALCRRLHGHAGRGIE